MRAGSLNPQRPPHFTVLKLNGYNMNFVSKSHRLICHTFRVVLCLSALSILHISDSIGQETAGSPLFIRVSTGWASLGTGSAKGYGVGIDFSKSLKAHSGTASGAIQVGGEFLFHSGAGRPSNETGSSLFSNGWYEQRSNFSIWTKGSFFPIRTGVFKRLYGSFGPTLGINQVLRETTVSITNLGGGLFNRQSKLSQRSFFYGGLRLSIGFDIPVSSQWYVGARGDWELNGLEENDLFVGARLTYVLQ